MSFTNLLEQTATVTRLAATTGIKKAYTTIGTYPTLIQPLSAITTPEVGMAMGKTYRAYFDITADVRVSDGVTDNLGNVYRVTGVMPRHYGSFPHLSVDLNQEPGA